MKYKSCFWLTSGINFLINEIRFCCFEYLHSKKKNIVFSNYNGEKINYDKFFKIKKEFINRAKSGDIHPNCINCVYLENENWADDDYFDHFLLNYWTNCNSRCIYCGQAYWPLNMKKQYYKLIPILHDMKKNNLIKNTKQNCVVFGGGEPTILKEFDDIMLFFLNEGYNNIRVNSSGIKYSKILEEALMNNCASLVISTDSGSREMYEKIKRVKSFDNVWTNIAKYAKNSNYSNNLKIKYIIIPGINSSFSEIDNFFELILKNNVKSVAISVEIDWYTKFYPNFPNIIFELIQYFENKANEYGLEIEEYSEAKSVLKCRKSGN